MPRISTKMASQVTHATALGEGSFEKTPKEGHDEANDADVTFDPCQEDHEQTLKRKKQSNGITKNEVRGRRSESEKRSRRISRRKK
jgi:hypothetical protein